MARIEGLMGSEREGARAASRSVAVLGEAVTYFALAIAGMLIVFIGLAVDAYRHNNGAGEESLLSMGNPGHLLAAIGLGITAVSLLAGLTVSLLKGIETTEALMRRFVPVTAAWVTLAAVGIASVTYIGASGVTVGHGDHDDSAAATTEDHGSHSADDAAGVAAALEEEGIDPTTVDGALTQGSNGDPNNVVHDHGKHPTFTEFSTTSMSDDRLVSLFPSGTLSKDDLPSLRAEVEQTREVALQFPTTEAASAGGFVRTTSDVPFMGQHWINFDYLRDGKFDPTKPEGLLFSKIDDGPEKLVGVWFLQIPGIGDVVREVEPAGFSGDLDLWHAHIGLCIVGLTGASEGETAESCAAKGGRFTADLRWMMHVWVAPEATENPDGFFAYLNSDLFAKQTAAKEAPSGVTAD